MTAPAITLSPSTAELRPGAPVTITVALTDPDLVDVPTPARVTVTARDEAGNTVDAVVDATVVRQRPERVEVIDATCDDPGVRVTVTPGGVVLELVA